MRNRALFHAPRRKNKLKKKRGEEKKKKGRKKTKKQTQKGGRKEQNDRWEIYGATPYVVL